jgi:hypothetical protein
VSVSVSVAVAVSPCPAGSVGVLVSPADRPMAWPRLLPAARLLAVMPARSARARTRLNR